MYSTTTVLLEDALKKSWCEPLAREKTNPFPEEF
jgi:hypothetical protein